ncbi:hypothetical protein [uncultured Rubinisphaera sp.]|uniref:hypothetical protein n=1 Tax=uncultured Rubinisphaera sp. TaxID=1678686 RepID=UPI0030D6E0FD
MTSRLAYLVLIVMLLPDLVIARDDPSLHTQVGDQIVLDLSGKPAATYLRLLKQPVPEVPDDGFCVQLVARIIRIDHDNLIAEFQIMREHDTDVAQLISVSVSFSRDDLVDRSNYPQPYGIANTEKERLVQTIIAWQDSLPNIRKNSFEGIKIRVWSLDKEISE